MSETITLNDGTVINGHVIESSGVLFVYMYDISFAEAFELLIEPEKTKKIKTDQNGDEQTITGYKHLISLREEDSGMITASLKKV